VDRNVAGVRGEVAGVRGEVAGVRGEADLAAIEPLRQPCTFPGDRRHARGLPRRGASEPGSSALERVAA
jgi:hypothetical protein